MKRLLFLVRDLRYRGQARQMMLVAPRLLAEGFEVRVSVLGRMSPWSEALRQTGVCVDVLGWGRPLDLNALRRLGAVMDAYRPDVIHAWDLCTLRAAALLRRGRPWLVSEPFARGASTQIGWLDQRLLRRVAGAFASNPIQAAKYRHLGLSPTRIVVIPPAVEIDLPPPQPMPQPNRPRLIVCVGPLERHKGFRDAVWALDILKYLFDDLHLAIVGDGPERQPLERFSRAIGADDRIHFAGPQSDVRCWLARADVVWVPATASGGRNVALEAMALGRPVVAARVPGLVDTVTDGATGLVIPPGDKAALARQTRLILEDATLGRRLGEAGRKKVENAFDVRLVASRYAAIYRELAA